MAAFRLADPFLMERAVRDRDHELHRRRRTRNIATLALLAAFAALLFAVTVVKMGENAGNPWS